MLLRWVGGVNIVRAADINTMVSIVFAMPGRYRRVDQEVTPHPCSIGWREDQKAAGAETLGENITHCS